MLLPTIYAIDDRDEIAAFVQAHSFATVVGSPQQPRNSTSPPIAPVAAHLPLLYKDNGRHIVLRGHLASENPLTSVMRESQIVMAIFTGPHGYISPTWYENPSIPPTWNFTAAHLSGTVTLFEDDIQKIDILRETIATYEKLNGSNWSLDTSTADTYKMLQMITAFEINVENIQCCYKLSQNRSLSDRKNVIENLKSKRQAHTTLLADWMATKASGQGTTDA